jgi:hypothetical protein
VTESEYFGRLEMRICRELQGMREKELREIWCDGFIPEEFSAIGNRSRITGRVWTAFGRKSQECWGFVLNLGLQALDRDEVDWDALMPGENSTGWLSLDFKTKFVKISPLAAYPDRVPATPDRTDDQDRCSKTS